MKCYFWTDSQDWLYIRNKAIRLRSGLKGKIQKSFDECWYQLYDPGVYHKNN